MADENAKHDANRRFAILGYDRSNTQLRMIDVDSNGRLKLAGDVDVDMSSIDTTGLVGKSSGGDFTTAYASATTIDCTNLPSYHATLLADDIVSIVQVATGGGVTATYHRDDAVMSVTTNTITVTGATFAATDTFIIYTNIARETSSASSTQAKYRATSTGRGDGTAVYASATTLTLAGLPFTLASEDIVYIKEVDETGNTAQILVNGSGGVHMEVSGATLTISGGSFTSGSAYEVGYNGQDKGYDSANSAQRNEVINRDKDDQPYDTLLDLTNITDGTAYGYIDMEGYKNVELQIETSGTTPTSTLTLTLEGSCQNDGTAAASVTYQDVTQDELGVASVVDQDDWWRLIDVGYKYLRIKHVTAGGGDDCDLTVYVKKWS